MEKHTYKALMKQSSLVIFQDNKNNEIVNLYRKRQDIFVARDNIARVRTFSDEIFCRKRRK